MKPHTFPCKPALQKFLSNRVHNLQHTSCSEQLVEQSLFKPKVPTSNLVVKSHSLRIVLKECKLTKIDRENESIE